VPPQATPQKVQEFAVKQRLRRDRVRFESLDNGFLSCPDPDALQTACDALGPADIARG